PVPHDTCAPRNRPTDRSPPCGIGSPLQRAGDPMELREIAIETLVGLPEHVRILMNHRLHDRQFPDEIDEAVELTRVDLDGRLTRSALESDPASALRRFLGIVGMWRWRKLLIGRRGFAEVIQSGDE